MLEVTFSGPKSQTANGYAHSTPNLVRYLADEGIALVDDGKPRPLGMCYGYPRKVKEIMRCEQRIVFSMFESDEIPASWDQDLAHATKIVVPSPFCRDAFGKRGWKAEVVPLGIEHDLWPPIVRMREPGVSFTFLQYESLNARKGFFELFKAWQMAFEDDPSTRLILKTTRKENVLPLHAYPNIEVVRGELTREGLLMLLARADCFVFPSRGEGFGHTPLEALSTGLPVIAPNEHGIATYFDHRYMMPHKTIAAIARYDHIKEPTGMYRVADPLDLARVMQEAKAIIRRRSDEEKLDWGIKAHAWVQENWTYRRTARELAAIIKRLCS